MPAAKYWRLVVQKTNKGSHFAVADMAFLDANGADVSLGGSAIASSAYNSDFAAAKAFDKNTSVASRWATAFGALPGWIGYIHPVEVAPVSVRVFCDNDPNNGVGTMPTSDEDVSLEYSADGVRWSRLLWSLKSGAWLNGGSIELAINHAPIRLIAASLAQPMFVRNVGMTRAVTSGGLVSFDREFGGQGRLWGTTKTEISPGVYAPTKARVSILRQRDKLLAREVWSDPATGAWEVRGLDTTQTFIEVAQHVTGEKQAVAADQTVPVEVAP